MRSNDPVAAAAASMVQSHEKEKRSGTGYPSWRGRPEPLASTAWRLHEAEAYTLGCPGPRAAQ